MKKTLIPLLALFIVLFLPWTASAGDTGSSVHRTVKKIRHATVATKHSHHYAKRHHHRAKRAATAKRTRHAHLRSTRHAHKTRVRRVSTKHHYRHHHHRHYARLGHPPVSTYTGSHPILRSSLALVVDQKTGQPIYAKNPDQQAPIASITKLMTAMVTLDAHMPLDDDITISAQDVDHLKHTRSRLAVGTTLSRGELLHLALIASENRAAAALSRAYPGGRSAFVAAMNRKALELGMDNTHYVDGTGLSSENQSTAADLAKLVSAAYRYPLIREITTTGSYQVDVPVGSRVRRLVYHNTDALTRYKNWDIGISKTGFINEAGHCLVMQAKIAEKDVIIVLLDSWGRLSRIGDANRIRLWLEHHASRHLAIHEGSENV